MLRREAQLIMGLKFSGGLKPQQLSQPFALLLFWGEIRAGENLIAGLKLQMATHKMRATFFQKF